MFFTSGTSGYPKLVMHDHAYAIGHFITAKWWHNIDGNGVHLTIADTGWGKAVWGKLYGQWLMGNCVFVYDFTRFNADDMLSVIEKHKITTFCAPPPKQKQVRGIFPKAQNKFKNKKTAILEHANLGARSTTVFL